AGTPLPPFDVHAPLMSLPGLLGTTLANVPAEVPYLRADAELASQWRRQLAPRPGLKVGIAWQGNPAYKGDRQRSFPLSQFEAIARVPGVCLVSLQKGPGALQLKSSGFAVLDWTQRLDTAAAFIDTAALMMSLDLVLT